MPMSRIEVLSANNWASRPRMRLVFSALVGHAIGLRRHSRPRGSSPRRWAAAVVTSEELVVLERRAVRSPGRLQLDLVLLARRRRSARDTGRSRRSNAERRAPSPDRPLGSRNVTMRGSGIFSFEPHIGWLSAYGVSGAQAARSKQSRQSVPGSLRRIVLARSCPTCPPWPISPPAWRRGRARRTVRSASPDRRSAGSRRTLGSSGSLTNWIGRAALLLRRPFA